MDDITTRAIVIAVNIFVTITIVSLVIIMFFQMKEIYGIVATTDTSIYNKFDDVFSMYHGKEETGIGLLNALKRYEDDTTGQVIITYTGSATFRGSLSEGEREVEKLKKAMEDNDDNSYNYEDKYTVTVYDNGNETVTIHFERTAKVKK